MDGSGRLTFDCENAAEYADMPHGAAKNAFPCSLQQLARMLPRGGARARARARGARARPARPVQGKDPGLQRNEEMRGKKAGNGKFLRRSSSGTGPLWVDHKMLQ